MGCGGRLIGQRDGPKIGGNRHQPKENVGISVGAGVGRGDLCQLTQGGFAMSGSSLCHSERSEESLGAGRFFAAAQNDRTVLRMTEGDGRPREILRCGSE
jgi:hypothetical protein